MLVKFSVALRVYYSNVLIFFSVFYLKSHLKYPSLGNELKEGPPLETVRCNISLEREDHEYIFCTKIWQTMISEETFEITIENVNRCVWCTVPDSRFLYSLPALIVDRKRLYKYKKEHFGRGELGRAHQK